MHATAIVGTITQHCTVWCAHCKIEGRQVVGKKKLIKNLIKFEGWVKVEDGWVCPPCYFKHWAHKQPVISNKLRQELP